MNSKKTILVDEIDISRIIISIWKNKWKVFLITLLTVAIAIFLKVNTKISEVSFLAKTQILPISTFDDHEFLAFNTYLARKGRSNVADFDKNGKIVTNTIFHENFRNNSLSETSFLTNINKNYLYNLFIEKLNEKDLFIKAIKEFELVKKENYQTNKEYENSVINLASSIKIITDKKNIQYIQFRTSSKRVWKDLLNFIQNSANFEIQNYLRNNFNLFIQNAERLKKYKIEDIELEIANNLENEVVTTRLQKMKKRTEENKDIERLKDLFENTAIVTSKNFTAAKFNIQLTDYKENRVQSYSMKKTIISSTLLGILLGIFYVLILITIQKRPS